MRFPVLKQYLSRLGPIVPAGAVHFTNGILNYLTVGRWFHERNLKVPQRFSGREPLYDYVAKKLVEPVSYLEFGVFKGFTLRYWSKLLRHPDSFLHGFDSFEGLPENWRIMDKSLFDVGGRLPVFDDSRVQLFKGWFSDTLPNYLTTFKPRKSLALHLDADLYSSTAFVLKEMRPFINPGTVLIFDEFFDREHELKAFTEFLDETGLKVECIAATRALTQAAFRVAVGAEVRAAK